MSSSLLKSVESAFTKASKIFYHLRPRLKTPLTLDSSRDEIHNFQLTTLKDITKKAMKTSFYSKKFEEFNLRGEVNDVKDLESIIVSGEELRKYKDAMRNPHSFPYFTVVTSGTGGKPLEVDVTLKQLINVYPIQERTIEALGIEPEDKILSILHRGSPCYWMALLYLPFSRNAMLADYRNVEEQIQGLRKGASVIFGYSTPLLRLAQNSRAQDIGKNIRLVVYAGEPLPESGERILKESFDAEVRGYYGAIEVYGPIGWMCKEGRYHVVSDYVLLQQDKDNNAIVTCLDKDRGTILIRYAGLKDKVQMRGKCPCGLNFPSFELKGTFRHLDGQRIAEAIYNSDAFKQGLIGPYFDFRMEVDPKRGKRIIDIEIEKLSEFDANKVTSELENIIIHGSGKLQPSKPLQAFEDMLEFRFNFVDNKQINKIKSGGLRRGYDV